MPGASRSVEVNAPMDQVMKLITQYELYSDFLPEVKNISVLERSGNRVKVQYELNLFKTIRYSLWMEELPPNRVAWTFVEGDLMKDNHGEWRLEDLGAGRTRVTYTIELSVGMLVPKAIINTLMEQSLPKMLENFKKRAESGNA